MIAFISGIFAGTVGGMGIGGGAILIPALVFIFGTSQHTAQGINLIFFIPTSLAAIYVHVKNKNIDFKIAITIIIFGVIGAAIGSCLAANISATILRKLFAGLLFVFGLLELFKK